MNAPELSVIIPTLGRGGALGEVLDRLQGQRLAPDRYEVVVAADATHPDPARVESALADRPFGAVTIQADLAGASAARNRGLEASSGSIALFLGDDILPSKRLLAEHLKWHRRHPEDEVGVLGRVRWARRLRITPFMRWLEHGMQFDYPAIQGREAGWARFYTANASVKRALVEAAGGFDEARLPYLYEDLDLGYRMHGRGFRLLYNRRALGEHLHPTDVESWRARIRVAARAERAFVSKHPEIRPHFEPLFRRAVETAPARGRGARLIHRLPRWVPWAGPRAWASADLHFRQALAPDFLAVWDELDRSAARGPDDLPARAPGGRHRARR